MEQFTHAYCEMCGMVAPVIYATISDDGLRRGYQSGGHLVCAHLGHLIATVYHQKEKSQQLGVVIPFEAYKKRAQRK
jgi:hypothetical protein